MSLPPVLNSIVSWLKAGYPYGVPDSDYIPLLALLARRLTSEEVAAVAAELGRQVEPSTNGSTPVQDSLDHGHAANGGATVDNCDIGVLITKITNELPRAEDIARVRAHLDAAGPFL
jgi:hypothetical protein